MIKENVAERTKKVGVTVEYTGHDDFQDEFSPEVPLGTIKRKAMHQFGIEPNAADNYVLQLNGANLDDKTKVGDLDMEKVTLSLSLKKPQEKGYGR